MRYDLAALARQAGVTRRKPITFRDIRPPAMLATNLYQRAYAPLLARWEARIPAILAEYERTLAAMTTDSPADIQAQLDAATSEMERLFILLDAAIRSWCLESETWQRGAWVGSVLSATNVPIETLIGPEEVRDTLANYIAWNSRLVRDVSDQAAKRIADAVFAGVQNRTPAREVAKQIQEAMAMSRRRALAIASDQTSKVTSALAAERRRQAGLSVYKFRHSGKRHPRADHLARNGKLYAENQADAGREVDGQVVNDPIPEDQRAGRPPFCGCRELGVLIWSD